MTELKKNHTPTENPFTSKEKLAGFMKQYARPVNFGTIMDANPFARAVIIGTWEQVKSPLEFFNRSLASFKTLGFTHVALEVFPAELQKDIDNYLADNKTPKDQLWDNILTKFREEPYLETRDIEFSDLYQKTLDEAKESGIKIVASDIPTRLKHWHLRSRNYSSVLDYEHRHQRRDNWMAGTVNRLLRENPKNKIIVLAGLTHVSEGNVVTEFLQSVNKYYHPSIPESGPKLYPNRNFTKILHLTQQITGIPIVTIGLTLPLNIKESGLVEEAAQSAGLAETEFMLPCAVITDPKTIPEWYTKKGEIPNLFVNDYIIHLAQTESFQHK